VFTSVDELLASADVDAIAVLTPPATHAAIAAAAIRARKHVFVEKPVTLHEEDGFALTRMARDQGVCAGVGHNLRFHRMVERAREALKCGCLGELTAIQTMWSSGAECQPAWQCEREGGGGVLFDLGVHHVDLVRCLTGDEFEEVRAVTETNGASEVAASISGRTNRGVLVSAVWSKKGGQDQCVRLVGTCATLEFSMYRGNGWRLVPAGAGGLGFYVHEAREYWRQWPDVVWAMRHGGDMARSYQEQWLDFARAVSERRDPACTLDDAARNVAVCRSLQAGGAGTARSRPPPSNSPELSVILSVKGRWDLVRRTVAHLRAQTRRNRIELVLVFAGLPPHGVPASEVAGFHAMQMVSAPADASVAEANAAGIRAATAEVVAFAEDHCYPEPYWAAALIDAHSRGYAAVGPEIANANPGSVVSWCDYLIGYGPWMSPCPAGPVPFLPGHNSSYKKRVLLGYGKRLEAMLESETVLHFDLIARGHTLYLEPGARAAHVNFAQWGVWIPVQYQCGRMFAGSRAAGWRFSRKLFYGFASPLIPAIRVARICRELMRPRRPSGRLFRILPALLVGLAADGFGQMIGYFTGPGDSARRLAVYEYDRLRFVRPEDRKALERADAAAGS
jgi:predicted dehydrogenase